MVRAGAVRVGTPPLLLDQATYEAASPDPLRHDAPQVPAHLDEGHADALATCLRAGGHRVGFARAVRLDAGGLTVLAVSEYGVDTVRLRFPSPVGDLRELPPSLRGVLSPGCRCCASGPSAGRALPSEAMDRRRRGLERVAGPLRRGARAPAPDRSAGADTRRATLPFPPPGALS